VQRQLLLLQTLGLTPGCSKMMAFGLISQCTLFLLLLQMLLLLLLQMLLLLLTWQAQPNNQLL
jgi:hypothetical protein